MLIRLCHFRIVVELEKMNADLQDLLNDVQGRCQEIAPEPSVAAMLAPSHLREKCRQEASDMVAKNNMINESEPTSMNQLVTDLTALMLQVKVSVFMVSMNFINSPFITLKVNKNKNCPNLIVFFSTCQIRIGMRTS